MITQSEQFNLQCPKKATLEQQASGKELRNYKTRYSSEKVRKATSMLTSETLQTYWVLKDHLRLATQPVVSEKKTFGRLNKKQIEFQITIQDNSRQKHKTGHPCYSTNSP